ncbi:MAG: hypothetical protein IJH70_04970 [Oscillospiraceae bacterium]|nr:hypothetical protein [Oscillospiraceae bacterium]
MFFNKEDKKKDNDRRKDSSDEKTKKQSQPWYDISEDDLIKLDMMNDD